MPYIKDGKGVCSKCKRGNQYHLFGPSLLCADCAPPHGPVILKPIKTEK